VGVSFDTFDKTGYLKGLTIDTNDEKSPYRDGTNAEKINQIKADYGEKVKIHQIANGKFVVRGVGDGYFAQRSTLKATVGKMGVNAVSTAAKTRILGKFFGISWHPLHILDRKVNKTAAERYASYKKKWDDRINKGVEPAAVDGSKAKQQGTDSNGKPTTTDASAGDQATIKEAPANSGKILKGIKAGGGIAGGLAAAAGIACGLKAVDDNIAAISYAQVIVPLMRVGESAIAIGAQIQLGHDVDPDELQYLSHNFNQVEDTVNKVKASNWTDAATIRANTGDSGGVDINQGVKDAVAEKKPAWLDWTQSGVMDGLCSTAGSIVTNVISIGVGVLSGGIVSTLTGVIVSGVVSGPIIDFISHLFAGKAINPDTLSGAAYGNAADYGTALATNAAVIPMGGVAQTAGSVGEINTQVADEQRSQFESQSMFARMFNMYDYRSLASTIIDGQSTSFTQNILKATTGVGSTFSNVLQLPLKLYTSSAHAATAGYQYPFPIYGYSLADQANPAVADPYANAEDVAQMLDGNAQNGAPDYIQKAMDCFGVTISKDNGDGVWDVTPAQDINVYDKDHYNPTDCEGLTKIASTSNKSSNTLASYNYAPGSSETVNGNTVTIKTAAATTTYSRDANWFKLRFFILDTGIMEGLTCAAYGDDQSCANNMGDTSVASDTNVPDATTDQITGDRVSLAKQILDNAKIHLSASAKDDITKTAAGQKVTPGPLATTSSGEGTLGACPAGQAPTDINETLLKEMLVLAQTYDYSVQDIVSGHTCDTGKHPVGRAFDISALNGKPIQGSCTSSDVKAFGDAIASSLSTLVGTSGQGSIGTCGDGLLTSPPGNVGAYVEAPDQIHVSVWSP
jgi:hypothetical protein